MAAKPKKDTVKMGELIKQAREKKGVSRKQLVEQMEQLQAQATPKQLYYGARGLSLSAISRIEAGHNGVSGLNLELIAAVLEVPAKSLIVQQNNLSAAPLLLDLPYIDLDLISVPARASFASMCGAEGDYGSGDTVRLYLSSPSQRMKYEKQKVFTSYGDSMDGIIADGAKVIAQFVPKEKWEFVTNKVCIVSYSDVVTIKNVFENELFEKNLLTLYPSRLDMAPLRIPREHIVCIWEVTEFFDRPLVQAKRF